MEGKRTKGFYKKTQRKTKKKIERRGSYRGRRKRTGGFYYTYIAKEKEREKEAANV